MNNDQAILLNSTIVTDGVNYYMNGFYGGCY